MFFSETRTSGTFLAQAWVLVEEFVQQITQLSSKGPPDFLKSLNMNDFVEMAERFLEMESEFRRMGKPSSVDIGYHYTRAKNILQIRNNGLLTKIERDQKGISTNYNGSLYGDGIYTANNPGEFYETYGPVGLIVLRIQGRVGMKRSMSDDDINTIIDQPAPMNRMVVLKTSSQCLPILQYDATKINRHNPKCRAVELLVEAHQTLQRLVDSLLNCNFPNIDSAPFKLPDLHDCQPLFGAPPARLGTIFYNAPLSNIRDDTVSVADTNIVLPFPRGSPCLVCRGQLGTCASSTVQLECCGHMLHLECLEEAERFHTRCPYCQESTTALGSMPTGSMHVTRDSLLTCPGHDPFGTLRIEYKFDAGIQSQFHPSPGKAYAGTVRYAYIPDFPEGRALLSRLQDAFRHGLSFQIGTSRTHGQSNVITWSPLIPHKSYVKGGALRFGYPDDMYFADCHAALDAIGVRPAGSDSLLLQDDKISA